MSLQSFLSSRYDSEAFERFLSERFFGLEFYDTVPAADYLNETEKKSFGTHRSVWRETLQNRVAEVYIFVSWQIKNKIVENEK